MVSSGGSCILLNAIYKAVNRPLLLSGLIEFDDFHGVAIGKAPISGRNIFSNHKEYYPNLPIALKKSSSFHYGGFNRLSRKKHDAVNQLLETVLYRTAHPGDINHSLITSHAHVLTLKQPVVKVSDITPQVANQTPLNNFIRRGNKRKTHSAISL